MSLSCTEITYIVSQMRALNRPLTVDEAYAQVDACGRRMTVASRKDAALRILGLIAAQEFKAAREARKQARETVEEKRIIRKYLKGALDLSPHYIMVVNDGGQRFEVLANIARAINIIYTVSEAKVTILDGQTRESIGTLLFVLGNAPDEVLADWGFANSPLGHALDARLENIMREIA